MSEKNINIRDVTDAFERYQMPCLEVSTKSKGQFSDTVIGNITKVAKAIRLNPECLLRWFGWSLKTQAKQRDKDTIVIKGTFSYELILKNLRKLINNYVLCPKCTLPELNYNVKGKVLWTVCRACGERTKVNVKADRVWKLIHRLEVEEASKNPKRSKNLGNREEDKFKEKASSEEEESLPESKQTALNGNWAYADDDDDSWADDWGDSFSAEAVEARKREEFGTKVLENLIQ